MKRFRLFLPILIAVAIIASGFAVCTSMIARAESNAVAQTIDSPNVTEQVKTKLKTSWSWYLTRASGMVAAGSLVVLMISGIGQITGLTYKLLDPITSWASHRALGIAFGVSVIIHMVGLLFDHFVPFSIPQLLVPWLSNLKPVTIFGVHLGSLYVALGVIAFYLTWIIVVTSLIWVDKKPGLWKLIHLLSYLVIAFVFVHALYLGTDLSHGVLRWLWIASGALLLIMSLKRLMRARTV